MRSGILIVIFAMLALPTIIMPAFAEGSNVGISITGGSMASQRCVEEKNCYDPGVVTVSPESVITWTNMDNTAHTVTSGNPSDNQTGTIFDSGMIGPRATYSFIFLNPGKYDYFCSIHPWMTGEIIVTNGAVAQSNGEKIPEFGPMTLLVLLTATLASIFLAKRLSHRF